MIRKGTMIVITNRIGLVQGELELLKQKGEATNIKVVIPQKGFLRCFRFSWALRWGVSLAIGSLSSMGLSWCWLGFRLRCHSGGESLVGGCWWLLRFRIEIGHVAAS
jgi:hypothetical protein